jgi:PTS system nitrogen regulatory IIA component
MEDTVIGDSRLDVWLSPGRVRVGLDARRLEDVVAAAAELIAADAGCSPRAVESALGQRSGAGGFAIGDGVAIPHAEIEGLERPIGALITTREPLDVGAPDGAPADIFFPVVAPPGDPVGHLRILADLALLSRSPLLRTALRRAPTADEAWSLLEAAEPRRRATRVPAAVDTGQLLAVVAIAGEHAVDELLVELMAQGFDGASVLDAQTLQDAATSEVPLFADFRDLFGDPGGRRIFVFEIDSGRSDWLVDTVRRVCEEREAAGCSIALIPVAARWRWQPPKVEETPSGH